MVGDEEVNYEVEYIQIDLCTYLLISHHSITRNYCKVSFVYKYILLIVGVSELVDSIQYRVSGWCPI